MKSRPIGPGQNILSSQNNDRRDDARGGSFLLPHQQLGALALGTTPSNNQTITVVGNGTSVVFTAVTGSPTNPGDVKAPGTAAGFVTNFINALRRPDLTTSTFIALSSANQALIQYVGWAWPGSSTNVVPFSLNKNVNGNTDILTSFNVTTTVTSGTWTAQTMQLYIEDGTYYIGLTKVLFTGGSTPTFTAPSSHPRIDLVTADSSGTIAIVTGTENASPSAPAYPANKLVICEVYNVVGETGLFDNENQQASQGYIYNDVRPTLIMGGYISSSTQLARGVVTNVQEGTDAGKPGSPSVGDIYIATDTAIIYGCFTASTWTAYASSSEQRQYFSSSGTFVAPAGVTTVFITMAAGGSGGGACSTTSSNRGGGGGTAGSIAKVPYTVTPGNSYTVTVGALGTGATIGNNDATAGGNTVFDALTVTAGTQGTTGVGGANGTAGSPGSPNATTGTAPTSGSNLFASGITTSSAGAGTNASNGSPGIGGAGAFAGGGGTAFAGGNGAKGFVLVEW